MENPKVVVKLKSKHLGEKKRGRKKKKKHEEMIVFIIRSVVHTLLFSAH